MKAARIRVLIAILLAVVTVIAGCGTQEQKTTSTGLKKVTITPAIDSLVYGPIYLANHLGYFKEEGIDATVTVMGGGGNAIQALQSGDLDFVAQNGGLFTAAQQGIRLITPVLLTKDQTLDLVVRKEIAQKAGLTRSSPIDQRLALLKGMTLAIPDAGGAGDLYTRYLLSTLGLDPAKDVKMVTIGSPAGMAAAMQKGQVDGFIVSPPIDVQAEADGFGYLLIPGYENPAFKDALGQALITRYDYYQKNKDTVAGVSRAVARGINYVLDHPDDAKKILGENFYTRYKKDVVSQAVDILAKSLPRSGMMSKDLFQRALDQNKATGVLKKDLDAKEGVYWTNEFVKQVK